jgi:hypothetical protein
MRDDEGGGVVEGGRDRNDRGEAMPVDEAEALRLILALAEALRAEFGVGVDAHPGGEGVDAGVVNRAFRVAVRCTLGRPYGSKDGRTLDLASILRKAAARRLVEAGTPEGVAEMVARSESRLGEAWPAYLLIAPASVIREILVPRS